MIRGPAVDTRIRLASRFGNLRALALLAFALPGLLLSGAVHLRVCLSEALDLDMGCATVETDCCAPPAELPSVADSPDCGVCCIAIDVGVQVPIAPMPDNGDGIHALPSLSPAAPGSFALASAATPVSARAGPRIDRPPGRAPTPLRI